jgi:hypothetical protein
LCMLDGQRSIQDTSVMVIDGSGGEMLHVRGFRVINGRGLSYVSPLHLLFSQPRPSFTHSHAREGACL